MAAGVGELPVLTLTRDLSLTGWGQPEGRLCLGLCSNTCPRCLLGQCPGTWGRGSPWWDWKTLVTQTGAPPAISHSAQTQLPHHSSSHSIRVPFLGGVGSYLPCSGPAKKGTGSD